MGGVGSVLAWVTCYRGLHGWCACARSVLARLTWVVCLREWCTNVVGVLLLLLLVSKYYLEEQNVECLLLKQKWKNVQNRFEQWFKRRTWFEELVLVYTIWTSNVRILNMPQSAEICPNVGKYSLISVTTKIITLWICVKHYVPK